LDLEKYRELSVFSTFTSQLEDIHLIFDTLLCHTKLQIKLKFGFDPLNFKEVMDLQKYYKLQFLYARLQTGRIMLWHCPSGVRPSHTQWC
jgi:hypothetical protein